MTTKGTTKGTTKAKDASKAIPESKVESKAISIDHKVIGKAIETSIDSLAMLMRGSSVAYPTPLQSTIRIKAGRMGSVKELDFKEHKTPLIEAAKTQESETANLVREAVIGYLVTNLLALQADHALLGELMESLSDEQIATFIGNRVISKNGHGTETEFSITPDVIAACRAFLDVASIANQSVKRVTVKKGKKGKNIDITTLIK